MKLIYREDCVSKNTDIEVTRFIHNQFLNHHLTHTVAFLCEGLEQNKELIKYINETHNWDLAISGWTNKDYFSMAKDKIEEDLDKCILKIEELFRITPEKWYLTSSDILDRELVARITDIAFYHGVDVDVKCDNISHAIKMLESHRNLVTNTIYFNGRNKSDLELLPNLFYLTRNP